MESRHVLTIFWSAFALAIVVGGLALGWAIAKRRKRRPPAPPQSGERAP